MNKIKKNLLKICIFTTISAFSINCFAMKNNDKENKTEKLSNNDFLHNPLNDTNFLNKKRTFKSQINEEPVKEQTKNIKENIKEDKKKNKEIKLEKNINKEEKDKENIKENQKEKENEIKDVINNKIKENSIEKSFEKEEEDKKLELDYELKSQDLINNIETKKINLKNIIDNNISEKKSNIFIFFKIHFDTNFLANLKINEAKIYKDFICYLLDKKMSGRQNWYSHLNKYLLKDLFKYYSDHNSPILGFCVSLEDNFMLPNFSDPKKENAYNTLEKFIENFEDSKTKILKMSSDEKDTLNLKKDELSKVIDEIFTLLDFYIINGNFRYWKGNYDYKKFKEEIFKKINDTEAKIIEDKNNLEEEIKEIHNHILNFLTINKENITNLKIDLSESEAKYLDDLNNKMLNIFKCSPELKNELTKFDNIKNEFRNFINTFSEKNSESMILEGMNQEIFNNTLNKLTLKEFKELMNNIYSFINVTHIDLNLKHTDFTTFLYPIKYIFRFKFDIPEKNIYLLRRNHDDVIKVIKDNIDKNLYNKKCIFGLPHRKFNDNDKTLELKLYLICLTDAFSTLFFDKNVVEWPFKYDVIDFLIIPQLKEEIPDVYANRLSNIYKKVIEDKRIDTKTLDIDKFLEEAKNYSLDEYKDKILKDKIYNIEENEENNFDINLFNKIKERYINDNNDIFNYSINASIYSFIDFQIYFMVETFAKNLKNRYSEFIKEILTNAKIKYNEEDYKLTAPNSGILKLAKNNPQEGYNFNFKLLLNDTLFENEDYINKNLKDDENKKLIINKAINDTITQINEMQKKEFYKKIIEYFEENKQNINKYIRKKDLPDDKKNSLCKNLKLLINIAKKENYNLNYLKDFKDTYIRDISFDIQKF